MKPQQQYIYFIAGESRKVLHLKQFLLLCLCTEGEDLLQTCPAELLEML